MQERRHVLHKLFALDRSHKCLIPGPVLDRPSWSQGRSETGSPLHNKDPAVTVADDIGAVSRQILILMPAVICRAACAACTRLGFSQPA